MQAFGITVALLGGMVAAPIFCFVLVKFLRLFRPVATFGFWVALTAVAFFALELVLVSIWGVLGARRHLGPAFFPIHALLTLGLAPACACALLLGRRSLAKWWPLVAVLCWFVGAAAIFYQYGVAETLYGIDGIGGPYQWPQ
jgi:hypothetical protein